MSRLNNSDLTPLMGTVVGIATMILEKINAKVIASTDYNVLDKAVPPMLAKSELGTLYLRNPMNYGDTRDMFVYHLCTRDKTLVGKPFTQSKIYTQRLYAITPKGIARRVATVDFRPYMLSKGIEHAMVSPIPKTLYLDKEFLNSLQEAIAGYPPLYNYFVDEFPNKSVEQVQGMYFLQDYLKL